MHSSIIYLKVKRVVIIRQSFRSTSPYQTCPRVLISVVAARLLPRYILSTAFCIVPSIVISGGILVCFHF